MGTGRCRPLRVVSPLRNVATGAGWKYLAGTRLLVDQVFGRLTGERVPVPPAVEFPFRGTTEIGVLEDLYSFCIQAPPGHTLDQVMRQKLGPAQVEVDAVVEFGVLRFRVQRLAPDGSIELVGMSILPAEPEMPATSAPPQETASKSRSD